MPQGTSLNATLESLMKFPKASGKTKKIPPKKVSLDTKILSSSLKKPEIKTRRKIKPLPKGISLDTIENFNSHISNMTNFKINSERKENIILNKTYTHIIENFSFGNLSQQVLIKFYKDGRHFAPVIELYLQEMFPIIHKEGCASYDFTDDSNNKYDEKTFTKRGCNFMPSSMIGTGRKFDKVKFNESANKLIYIIVGNINFPEIKIKFVRGIDLMIDYPNGKIPSKDFIKFFNR